MKKIVLLIIIFVSILLGLFVFYKGKGGIVSPLGQVKKIIEKPLEKYTFENLKKTDFPASEITIGKLLKDGDGFSSYMFYYKVPSASSGQVRKVSGLINLPKKEGTYPVILMFRGYVDREIYTTGEGTRRSAEAIASAGFITLAPDFLGYGDSDNPSNDSIEERFQTYTTALTLLASMKNLNKGLRNASCKDSGQARVTSFWGASATPESRDSIDCIRYIIHADTNKIGIWGHSNGGHISLSTLAISGKSYPTVLWNPVSKPFPYSILFFTDDYEDNGKALRFAIANFEKDYDIEKYSPTNYYSWINAPIQLHQATEDEAVPKRWSDQLSTELKKLDKDVIYFTYPGENHNFNNGSWPTAIQRSINFYKENF